MKALKFLFGLTLIFGLLISCSKNEDLLDENSDLELETRVVPDAIDVTITVRDICGNNEAPDWWQVEVFYNNNGVVLLDEITLNANNTSECTLKTLKIWKWVQI